MKTINGQILKEMLLSGSNNLYNHYPEIDALNVFPVPDGDTGMNMNLTCTSGAKEIQNRSDLSVSEIAKVFSRGLLMGARGNSGVITSQIFRGFSQGLEGLNDANAIQFAAAFVNGVKVAYKAVMRPVEGTILTVIRESATHLSEVVKDTWTITKCMDVLIKEAQASLKRTPELLPVLKEVGVVDSGGAGLIKILEGMKLGLEGHFVERNKATAMESENPLIAAGAKMEDEEFGYCTEFIMCLGPDSVKKPFNEKRFTNVLASRGNSIVVVHDEDIVKVHIHTLNPGTVLNYAQQFGEFLKLKIENMTEQHHALEAGEAVEPHEDLVEEEKPRSKYAIIAVSSGDGITSFFNDIGVNDIVKGGQTMNPSAEDFVSAIKKANADIVYILPNNSNILMAASQACEMMSEDGVDAYVIPSKTILQGITAAIMFDPDGTKEDNFREMKAALKNVKSGEVTFAIRDTEINGLSIKKDDFIGICEKEIVVNGGSKIEIALSLLEKMVDETKSIITVLIGQDVTSEESEALAAKISSLYGDFDLDMREGGQPVYSFLIGVE